MLYYTSGDLLYSPLDIFCHQTNCQGVMRVGIAGQIAKLFPEVEQADKEYCKNKDPLGTNLYIKVYGKYCVNMYAQRYYGTTRRQTDYNAFKKCLDRLAGKLCLSSPDLRIGFPYGIGCGLAGGDWIVIERLLKDFANKIPQDVYIVRKEDCYV